MADLEGAVSLAGLAPRTSIALTTGMGDERPCVYDGPRLLKEGRPVKSRSSNSVPCRRSSVPFSICSIHVAAVINVLGAILAPINARASFSASDPATVALSESTVVHAPSTSRGSRIKLSPMAALGVGVAATALPTVLVYALTSKDSRVEDVGLFAGVATGVIAGPAVGLWSGGRGDLAKRGLITRSVTVAICLGAMGVASGTWNDGTQAPALTVTLAILGAAGGFLAAASVFHDLAITPSATAEAGHTRVALVIRPDGRLALSARF